MEFLFIFYDGEFADDKKKIIALDLFAYLLQLMNKMNFIHLNYYCGFLNIICIDLEVLT